MQSWTGKLQRPVWISLGEVSFNSVCTDVRTIYQKHWPALWDSDNHLQCDSIYILHCLSARSSDLSSNLHGLPGFFIIRGRSHQIRACSQGNNGLERSLNPCYDSSESLILRISDFKSARLADLNYSTWQGDQHRAPVTHQANRSLCACYKQKVHALAHVQSYLLGTGDGVVYSEDWS